MVYAASMILTDNTVFLQKISHLPSHPSIESPHAKVFSNGMTIILHKMGSVCPLSLPKQFRPCKAPNVVYAASKISIDDTVFLQKISRWPSHPFIESPHANVFSNGMTIILHKMGSVCPLSLPKQFRQCEALIEFDICMTIEPYRNRAYRSRSTFWYIF